MRSLSKFPAVSSESSSFNVRREVSRNRGDWLSPPLPPDPCCLLPDPCYPPNLPTQQLNNSTPLPPVPCLLTPDPCLLPPSSFPHSQVPTSSGLPGGGHGGPPSNGTRFRKVTPSKARRIVPIGQRRTALSECHRTVGHALPKDVDATAGFGRTQLAGRSAAGTQQAAHSTTKQLNNSTPPVPCLLTSDPCSLSPVS